MGIWSRIRGAFSTETVQGARSEVPASEAPAAEDGEAISGGPAPLLPPPSGDHAVWSRAGDRLGRAPLAEAIAAQLAGADPEAGVVFGITGPWGSGKTSLLRMTKEALEEDHGGFLVLWFNPWLFTGTEHLMGVFFTELGAQLSDLSGAEWDELGVTMQSAGAAVQTYGAALSRVRTVPAAGGFVAAGGTTVSAGGGRIRGAADEGASLYERRRRLEKALRKAGERHGKRLVIVVDDLDRLRRQEIRDLVALVKLNADLPNLHFVLAYDRGRVEQALGEAEGDGRAYLEKIVQVVHDVPEARSTDVRGALVHAISEVTEAATETGPYDPGQVSEVLKEIVFPLVDTLRDVRRFINVLPVTLRVVRDEVALADVLGLEAIRLFLPDVYFKLSRSAGALTTFSDAYLVVSNKDRDKEIIRELLEAGGDRSAAVEKACELLFPAGFALLRDNHYDSRQDNEAGRERRVANWRFLRFFLDKQLPQDVLPARRVQDVFDSLRDPERLRVLLEEEDLDGLDRLMQRLQGHEDAFPAGSVMGAIPIISNRHARLMSEAGRGIDFGADVSYGGLMRRMLDKIRDPAEMAQQLKDILPRMDYLSARLELVTIVGHRPNTGERLVSEEDAEWFEDHMLTALEHASKESLAKEYALSRLLIRARQHNQERGERLIARLAEDDQVFLAALLRYYQRSSIGIEDGPMYERMPTLRWNDLCSLFGEETAKRRVRELRDRHQPSDLGEQAAEALELAHRCATGQPVRWRND